MCKHLLRIAKKHLEELVVLLADGSQFGHLAVDLLLERRALRRVARKLLDLRLAAQIRLRRKLFLCTL